MKKILLLTLFLMGCGSSTPFQRGSDTGDGRNGTFSGKPDGLDAAFFNIQVLPLVMDHCMGCHDDHGTSYSDARTLVVPGKPEESQLVLIGLNQFNRHKKISQKWSAEELTVISAWINGAAERPTPPVEPPPVVQPEPSQPPAEPIPTPTEPTPTPPTPPDTSPTSLDPEYFNEVVLPIIERDCTMCHDGYATSFDDALNWVVIGKPDESALVLIGMNKYAKRQHTVRRAWKANSVELAVIKNWINGAKASW